MKNPYIGAALSMLLIITLTRCDRLSSSTTPPNHLRPASLASKRTMRAFGSEQELAGYFRKLAEKSRLERRQMPAPAPPAAEAMSTLADAKAAGPAAGGESVTNVQHAGVDEGGIVKVHGDHLVVLRRGRLFTVALGKGSLDPVSSVDAFA